MLELKGIDKTFPGVHALKAVDFTVRPGEIVGLVGENGAGKSTLMKILYGAYQPDGGEMLVDGAPVRFANPRQAMERGVGMVFQEQSLITNLRVMENIFLGFESRFCRYGMIDWRRMAEAARHQLAKVHLDIDPWRTTSQLSFAQRQIVELAKVLTLEERVDGNLVILLDEPTSVLAPEEVELLFGLVRNLTSRAGFVFVSHRIDEVIELSDRIYVLKDGEVVDRVDSQAADIDAIQHKMVGRDINKEYYRETLQRPYSADAVLVSARGLGRDGAYDDISFDLHRGEVLTLVGSEASGVEQVMRSIFGFEAFERGTLMVKERALKGHGPNDSVDIGLGYVPRERKLEGIVGGMSVRENITLPQLGEYSRIGVLKSAAERQTAADWVSRLSIRTPSPEASCGNLSGGNQQKVVLAKWRSGGSDVMLLDHPTRGLDIGAKEDVYELVRSMCEAGCGVMLIADTLEEAIGLSHTIIVMKDGRMTQRFDCLPGSKPTLFDLVHHMI